MTSPKPPQPGTQGKQSPHAAPFAPWDTPDAPSGGNINPNARIDTSTATSTGPDYSGVDMDPDPSIGGQDPVRPSYIPTQEPNHYQIGHQVGQALGAHINNLIMQQIQSLME